MDVTFSFNIYLTLNVSFYEKLSRTHNLVQIWLLLTKSLRSQVKAAKIDILFTDPFGILRRLKCSAIAAVNAEYNKI